MPFIFHHFVIILFLSLNSFLVTASDSITCEGQYLSMEGDSPDFIKRELINNAFKNAITKAIKELKLDDHAFWNKYNEGLNRYIIEKKNLKASSGPTSQSENSSELNITDELISKINQIERRERLDLENAFLKSKNSKNLFHVIGSFIEKGRTRSSQNANLKYINIEANLNKIELRNIYNSYIKTFEARTINKIFLYADLSLKNSDYSELSISSPERFLKIIAENWKSRFEKTLNLPGVSIEIINQEKYNKLSSFFHSSNDLVDDSLSSSILIEINISIEKIDEILTLNQKILNSRGHIYLYDLLSKKNAFSQTFSESKQTIRLTSDESQNVSLIANIIHKVPLPSFKKLAETIGQLPKNPKEVFLEISGHKNLDDIKALSEMIILTAPELMIQIQIEGLKKDKISLKVNFNGAEESFEEAIRKLHNIRFKNYFSIIIPNKLTPYIISIKDERNEERAPIPENREN